jgi:two-component system response regulator HydG
MAAGLADYLREFGYDTEIATGGAEALARVSGSAFDVVISDLKMDGVDGMMVLDAVRRQDVSIPVFIMTAFGSIESAIEAVKRGAYHYFSKPLKSDEVRLFLDRAVEHRRLQLAQSHLLREVQDCFGADTLDGDSGSMRQLSELIDKLADSKASVLVTGESGTGKELVARTIHARGVRRTRPFVPVNCAAIPATLMESELFGHERGAFTGASRPRAGLAAEAAGGTLFLDEIGDLPLELQPKLLRLLQEGELRPVGSSSVRHVDVRVIAATNINLSKRVTDGEFREDLFYRLSVVPVHIPPLRERRGDIPLLAQRLLDKIRARTPRVAHVELTGEAMEALLRYDWPGNVRELGNALERAATLCSGNRVAADDLAFLQSGSGVSASANASDVLMSLREVERRHIERVLRHVEGSKVRAAAILGVDPSTLYRRMKKE